MVNYQYGKIYKIVAENSDKCYVGSTVQKYLSKRMQAHKDKYKSWKKGKRSGTSSFDLFDEFGFDKCTIILVELYPCESKDKLTAREEYWRKELKAINKRRAFRTIEDIKECKREENKKYYKKYKQKIRNHKNEKISCTVCKSLINRDHIR